MAAVDWNERDLEILAKWFIKGVYEKTHGVIGHTVFISEVFKHIEMKGYWGNETDLAKYFKFQNDNNVYKRNVDWVAQRLQELGYLSSSGSSVSLTRAGLEQVNNDYRDVPHP